MELQQLAHFLASYLAVEPGGNAAHAIRVFGQKEGDSALHGLRDELRQLFTEGASDQSVRELFPTQGRFQLGQNIDEARKTLLHLFEYAQTVSPSPVASKPYDVFISHATVDKDKATRIANELNARGYSVWLDSWEILVGHNIVDEVFRGITESEFVVVILSEAACRSEWVQEEFTTALVSEIEQRQVTVLPIKIEECEVPTALKNKRFANFAGSWEDGLRELTNAIDLHRAAEATKSPAPRNLEQLTFKVLDDWRDGVLLPMETAAFTAGLTTDSPYKDSLVGPPDNVQIQISKDRLMDLVSACTVQLRGWGGPLFPYDHYPSRTEIRLSDGIRYVDTTPWPYRAQSFYSWQINTSLRFMQRELLDEDFVRDESEELFLQGKLAKTWAMIDIVRPMLFARNILTHEKRVGALGVTLTWSGLRGRILVELSRRRRGFRREYRCRENRWVYNAVFQLSTDLLEEARKASVDLFWLFGWDPAPDALTVLDRDLETLISGSVPA